MWTVACILHTIPQHHIPISHCFTPCQPELCEALHSRIEPRQHGGRRRNGGRWGGEQGATRYVDWALPTSGWGFTNLENTENRIKKWGPCAFAGQTPPEPARLALFFVQVCRRGYGNKLKQTNGLQILENHPNFDQKCSTLEPRCETVMTHPLCGLIGGIQFFLVYN